MQNKKKKQLKAKPCRVCTFRFIPRVPTQVVCCPNCALALNKINKAKAYDKKTKALKQGIKTRSDYEQEAQVAFNKFIRARDSENNCISCGRNSGCQYHAGHYISVGADISLRFHTLNCHKQCATCNNILSANLVRYRRQLVKKIGIAKVEWLEGPHDVNKYTIEDLKRIKRIFNRKAKRELKKNDI
jgi:hypothetical protein